MRNYELIQSARRNSQIRDHIDPDRCTQGYHTFNS